MLKGVAFWPWKSHIFETGKLTQSGAKGTFNYEYIFLYFSTLTYLWDSFFSDSVAESRRKLAISLTNGEGLLEIRVLGKNLPFSKASLRSFFRRISCLALCFVVSLTSEFCRAFAKERRKKTFWNAISYVYFWAWLFLITKKLAKKDFSRKPFLT